MKIKYKNREGIGFELFNYIIQFQTENISKKAHLKIDIFKF